MRNIRLILLAAASLLSSACQHDTEEIAAAAQGFLEALGNYKPAEARPYATDQTCNVTLNFYEKLVENTDPSVYANNIPATITLGEIEIEDTVANVAFHKSTPSVQQDGSIRLVKRNRKWQVDWVIEIPELLNPDKPIQSHKFTDEEIENMRKNGKQSDSLSRSQIMAKSNKVQ